MKHLPPLLLITALLAGCADNGMSIGLGIGGGSRHFGLGTSLNIPIGGTTRTADNLPGGGEQTIAYFTADGQSSDHAVKGGFERRLLAKQNNEYLVQDFYSNGNKRTDPMRLARDNLLTFNARPDNGSLTVYSPEGKLLKQQVYRDSRPISAQP